MQKRTDRDERDLSNVSRYSMIFVKFLDRRKQNAQHRRGRITFYLSNFPVRYASRRAFQFSDFVVIKTTFAISHQLRGGM